MWRKKNDAYVIPPKPKKLEGQVSMMWDALFNHLPGTLEKQNRRLKWQDTKINFILVFVGLILASLAIYIYPLILALFR